MAERGRFELPVTFATPFFENGTINHSDTSPRTSVSEHLGVNHHESGQHGDTEATEGSESSRSLAHGDRAEDDLGDR
jgi:hypothetical protein